MSQLQESIIDLDNILVDLGRFGKFQKINYFLLCLVIIYAIFPMGYIFTTRSSNYRCHVNGCDNANSTYQTEWATNAIPVKGNQISRCTQYSRKNVTNLTDNCSIENFESENVIVCDTFIYENGELTIEKDFNISCDENLWKLTIIGTINNIGELICLPLTGYISDRYGRRTTMIISVLLSTFSGIMKSFSTNYLTYVLMEFFNTFVSSGILNAAYILAIELVIPEQRVLAHTVLSCAYVVGEVILGAVAWISPSWRLMIRYLYTPGLLFIFYYWWTNESVRWLLSKGRYDEAKAILKKVADTNRTQLTENVINKLGIVEERAETHETILNVLRTPKIFLRLVNCSFGWICCSFVYFGLTMHSVTIPGNLYVNFIAVVFIEIPAHLLSYYCLNKIGRKFSLSCSLILSGLACIAFIFFPEDSYTTIREIVFLIGKFSATISFGTMFIYTTEMFPTNLRNSLMSVCALFGKFGSMVAPQVPLLAHISKRLPLILFGALASISGLLSLFFPETLNTKLPSNIQKALNI